MEAALAEIEFLALSPNRVAILTELAEGPRSRDELAAATGASQATLGRILTDFEERKWVHRREGGYVTTVTGELIADGIGNLLDIVETEANLRPIVEYLPADSLGFDLTRLTDATIVRPSGTRPDAPIQRVVSLLNRAGTVRSVSHAFNERSLTALEERVTRGETTFEGVFSRAALRALTEDAVLRQRFRSLLATDATDIRTTDEEVPVAVTIADEVVHLLLRDQEWVLQASIDTDDEAVCEWASAVFEDHWEAGETLTMADL